MTEFAIYQAAAAAAADKLESALHSASLCLHMMKADPTDKTIRDYESALDQTEAARKEIGRINDAEMKARDIAACVKRK